MPRRDRGTQKRAVVVHPGAVVVVPILDNGDIVMIKNRRWQVGATLLEFPAGTIEPDEEIECCARRELIEETGFEACTMELIHHFFALPGISTEVMHVYAARGLAWVGQRLEPDEEIDVVHLSFDQLLDATASGEVVDGKTLAVIALFLSGKANIVEAPDEPDALV